jgi:transcriptional repressor NrdR
MMRAFDRRKVSTAQLEAIATEIEQSIQNNLDREVSTDKVGEMVMARLKPIDEVAYIRFASVYRRFQDVNSFIYEINQFLEEK